jgi:hypothetical protein
MSIFLKFQGYVVKYIPACYILCNIELNAVISGNLLYDTPFTMGTRARHHHFVT